MLRGEIMEEKLFAVTYVAYTVATILFLGYAFTKRENLSHVARWLLIVGAICHVASFIVRTYFARQIPQHSWYVPWSNWFESFSFFTLVIVVEFLIVMGRNRLPILGAFVMPLAWLALIVGINSPFGRQIPTLPPALQSYWMAIHVPVMFISYAAFTMAFGVGLAFLLQEWQLKSKKPNHLTFRLPSLDDMDRMIYRTIAAAFPILTVGVLLGATWAYDAWGRYWGWDPKETWALITWFIYAAYLHMRLVKGWRGRKAAYMSMLGFACVIFTYVGVNYISELHGFLSNTGR